MGGRAGIQADCTSNCLQQVCTKICSGAQRQVKHTSQEWTQAVHRSTVLQSEWPPLPCGGRTGRPCQPAGCHRLCVRNSAETPMMDTDSPSFSSKSAHSLQAAHVRRAGSSAGLGADGIHPLEPSRVHLPAGHASPCVSTCLLARGPWCPGGEQCGGRNRSLGRMATAALMLCMLCSQQPPPHLCNATFPSPDLPRPGLTPRSGLPQRSARPCS